MMWMERDHPELDDLVAYNCPEYENLRDLEQ